MNGFQVLASGAVASLTPRGRVQVAEVVRCGWLVRVPSGNPEPDSESDCWNEVECGATFRVDPRFPDACLGEVLICDNGHERLAVEIAWAPFGPEWVNEQCQRKDG